MSDRWFTNRGQIIQIFIAAIGCAIAAIVAWPAIYNQVATLGSVAFYAFGLLTVVLSTVWATTTWSSRRAPKPASVTSIAAPQPATDAAYAEKPNVGDLFNEVANKHNYSRHTIAFGGYAEVDDLKITALALRKIPVKQFLTTDTVYAIELKLTSGGRVFCGGEHVKTVDVNHFVVPVASDAYHPEDFCVYAFSFSKKHTSFTAIRVDHINRTAEEVELAIVNMQRLELA